MNKMNNYKDKMFNSTPLVGGLRPNVREPLNESSSDISGIFDKPNTSLLGLQAKNAAFRTPPRPPNFLSRRYSLSDVGGTSVYNQQSVSKNNGFQSRSPQHRNLSRFNSLNTSTQLDTQSPGYVGRVVRYSEEREKLMPTHQPKYGGVGVFPIVHLFKKDLPTLKRKPSRVTVRIASPELSRYNTPEHNRMLLESIVHTSPANRISPPHHSRMPEASTRSVLDALKEISRKRIHASEDIDLNDENKRIRIDCLDSKKRNRDPDSPQQENAVSPNNRLSKKMCAMNELKASYSSSMPDTDFTKASSSSSVKRKQAVAEISPNRKEAKQKNLVNAETQTTVPELTTTATNPEPEIPPLQQQHAEKSPESIPVKELQKSKKPSPPVKVFDEKPLEMMRKNRLQVLMGTLTKEKTKQTAIEGYKARLDSISSEPPKSSEKIEKEEPKEPRTPEKQTTPEKQLVSILSGPKKSPHKKHVTFSIPESSSSNGENLSFTGTTTPTKLNFNSNCSVTQTSTAISTPIVSSGVASSPIISPSKEPVVKHGGDSKLVGQNLASTMPQEKSVVSPFASSTVSSSSSVQFSFGSSPASEPAPAFKPNPVTVAANITLPKSLDVTSDSPGKKVGGFKFDLNKVSSPFRGAPSPPTGFGGTSNTEAAQPSFGVSAVKSPEGPANFTFSPKQSSFGSTTATTTAILPIISTPVATTSSSFGGAAKIPSSSLAFGVVPSTSSSSLGTNSSAVSFGGNAGNPPPAYGITTPSANLFGVAKGPSDNVFGNSSTTTTTTSSFSSFGSGAPPGFGASTNTFGGNNSTATPSFGGSSSTATPSFGGSIATPAFGSSATTTSTPIFGTVTTTSTPSFGANSTAPSFGATSTAPSFGTATTSAPFGFGAATTSFSGFGSTTTPSFGGTTSTPSFGAAVTTAPSFGGASATPSFAGASTTVPSFGATATPSFGTATTTAPSFGSATTSASTFGGSSSFTATTTAPPAYGSFVNTATTTSAFGSTSIAAPPAFGSNFGTPATTTTSAPSFGGFGSISAPKAFTFGNSNAPSFAGGSSSSITNPTFGTTVTSASNFGTQSTPSFTGPAMSTPSFNFGSTSSTSTTTAAPSFGNTNMFNSGTTSSFAASSKTPPAFGTAGATPSSFGNTSASFGSGTNTNSSFSGFGGTPTTTAENKFGSNNTTPFMFGSTNTSFNGGSSAFGTPTTTSAFGSAPTTTPSFGQATPTPSFGTAVTTASTFGAPTSTSSFSATANGFGSSTTFGNGTPNPGFGSTSTFGSSAPSSGFGSANASFGFGSTPSTNFGKTENGTSAFGQGGQGQGFGSATSAFSTPTTTQSGVFAFGSTTNPPKPGAIFSFGSGEPPKPSASFNFTGGAASSGTTFGGSNNSAPGFAPPGGFGGTPTPGQFGGAPQPGPPGLFSIGTGSSTSNRARTPLKAKRRT